MMRRYLFSLLLMIISCSLAGAMDFGLRFNSNSVPLEQRTSLKLGENPIHFNQQLMIGFFYNFYAHPLFGSIITLKANDGTKMSVVASHQGNNNYMMGLVINDHLSLLKGLLKLTPEKEDKIDIVLNKERNIVTLRLNNEELEVPFNLKNINAVTATFGVDQDNQITDAAPIELRNTRIFVDGKNTNWWDFKYHDTPDTRIDGIGGMVATVKNPHWLIDDHTDWRCIYSMTVKDNLQTAFDPEEECFYIAGNESIKKWFPLSGDSVEYKVNGGFRPMQFSNHLFFDSIAGGLINYNLTQRSTARFDFNSGVWQTSANALPDKEPNYSNHAFVINDSVAYAFGGYGFYKFHNDFFKINLRAGTIEECPLDPELMPLTSAAAAMVGSNLYIFGGKGNASGRQELPSKCYYTLYVYDTKTWKGKKVWEIDTLDYDLLPSQTMYYDELEDCFYLGSTRSGGEMVKISRSRPELTFVSNPIHTKMEYYDVVFDLFRSKDGKRFYLLIDKRIDPTTHEYAIYTINTPFISDPEVIKTKTLPNEGQSKKSSLWVWLCGGALLAFIILIVGGIYLRRKKKSALPTASSNEGIDRNSTTSSDLDKDADNSPKPDQPIAPLTDNMADSASVGTVSSNEAVVANQQDEAISQSENSQDDQGADNEEEEEILSFESHEDRARNSKFVRPYSMISLLGAFNVKSKTGEDITLKFTDRLKSLLILLLLSSTKTENGIKYQSIDSQIWSDKDEKSAQNNRNVYMRKLRILLEEVGNVNITYEKGYFRIELNDVMFDYGESMAHMEELRNSSKISPELLEESLDLLLLGPLLPMTYYDWLDNYKASYSDLTLEILSKLLKYELHRDDNLALKIAQTISSHEPLSEEAMKVKCILLSKKKLVGQAKKVYASFCKEYKASLAEDYKLSFPEVCHSSI